MDRFKLDTTYSINAESIANNFPKDLTLFIPYLQNCMTAIRIKTILTM